MTNPTYPLRVSDDDFLFEVEFVKYSVYYPGYENLAQIYIVYNNIHAIYGHEVFRSTL